MHGLARNRLDDGDQVLDAMTELARGRAQLLILLLDRGDHCLGRRPEQWLDVHFVCQTHRISPYFIASLSVVPELARTEPVNDLTGLDPKSSRSVAAHLLSRRALRVSQ